MTSEIQQEKRPAVGYDINYKGPEGFAEHFHVGADDTGPIIAGRTGLIEWLKNIGATPLPRDVPYTGPAKAAAQTPLDPMLVAAQQVLGTPQQPLAAAVGRMCVIHHVEMKRVPGTSETGKLSKFNKPYNAFWVCEAVEGCKGG